MARAISPTQALDRLLAEARQQGYQIRFESLGGRGGGACRFGGKRWLFVDLALPPEESVEGLSESLRREGVSLAAVERPSLGPPARNPPGGSTV